MLPLDGLVLCPGCQKPFMRRKGPGRPREYCSEKCAACDRQRKLRDRQRAVTETDPAERSHG